MRGRPRWLMVLLLAACSGCASTPGFLQLARSQNRGQEIMCKHCNCLMPANLEAEVICPVCDCGYHANACERGR